MTIKVSPIEEKKVVELNNALMEISKDNSTTGEEVKNDANAKLLILKTDEEGNHSIWQAKAGDFIQDEQPIDIDEIRHEIEVAKEEAIATSETIIDEKIDECIDLIDESNRDIKDNITTIINEKTTYVDGDEVKNNSENRYFTIINEQSEPEAMEKVPVDDFIPKDGVDLSAENVIYVKPDVSENVEGKIYKDYISAYNYIKNNEDYENREWTIELCADELSNDEGKNDNDIIMDKNIIVKGRNTKIKSAVVPYSPLRIKLNLFAKHNETDYFTAIGYIIGILESRIFGVDMSSMGQLPNNEYVNLEEYAAENPIMALAIMALRSDSNTQIKAVAFSYFLYWASKENILIIESDDNEIQSIINEIHEDYEFIENVVNEKYDEIVEELNHGNSFLQVFSRAFDADYNKIKLIDTINKLYNAIKNCSCITDCTITKIDLDREYEKYGINKTDSLIKEIGNKLFELLHNVETTEITPEIVEDNDSPWFTNDSDEGDTKYFTIFAQFLNSKECDIDLVSGNSVKSEVLQNTFRQIAEVLAMLSKRYFKIDELIEKALDILNMSGVIPMSRILQMFISPMPNGLLDFADFYYYHYNEFGEFDCVPMIDYEKTIEKPLYKLASNFVKYFRGDSSYELAEVYQTQAYRVINRDKLNYFRTKYNEEYITVITPDELPLFVVEAIGMDNEGNLPNNRICISIDTTYYNEHVVLPFPSVETLFLKMFSFIENIFNNILLNGSLNFNFMCFEECRILSDLDFPFNTALLVNNCNFTETELYEENLLTNEVKRTDAVLRARQIVALIYLGINNTMKEQWFFNNIFSNINIDNLYSTEHIHYYNVNSTLFNYNMGDHEIPLYNIANGLDKILIKLFRLYNNFADENGKIKMSVDPTILSDEYENEMEKLKGFIEVINDLRSVMFPEDGKLITFNVGCPEDSQTYKIVSDSTEFTKLTAIYEKCGLYLTAQPDETNVAINIADVEEYAQFIKSASVHDIAMIVGLIFHNIIVVYFNTIH